MTIDFTEEELHEFSPSMKPVYRETLLKKKQLLRDAGILNNGKRFSHFMAQFGAETAGGTIDRESLYYTTVGALRRAWRARAAVVSDSWIESNLLKKPVALGDWAYGGRMGNRKGTTDGYDFRGGGWFQTTGRENVELYCKQCGLEPRPDILDDHEATLLFACFEWRDNECDELADADNLMAISKAINVGSATSKVVPNGMENRELWLAKAKSIWWDAASAEPPAAPQEPPAPVAHQEPAPAPPPPQAPPPAPPAQNAEATTFGDARMAQTTGLWAWMKTWPLSEINEMADQGSRLAERIKSFKSLFWKAGSTAVAGGVALTNTETGTKSAFMQIVEAHPFLFVCVVLGIGGLLFYVALKVIEYFFLTACRDGRYRPRAQG